MTTRAQSWLTALRVIDGITVAHLDLAPNDAREREALAWLDKGEHDRRRRFRVERARRQFVLCRAALRALLCQHLGCVNDQLTFGLSDHGKPFALVDGRPAPYSFNISHGGRHGLIASAAQGALGVDVEERVARKDIDGLGERVFGPREQALLRQAHGTRKVHLFYALWTMKEALIKALGTGFSLDPSTFEVPSAMLQGSSTGEFRFSHDPAARWRLEDLGDARFAAAIAYAWDADQPARRSISAPSTPACTSQ